jgi:hypothetical protein
VLKGSLLLIPSLYFISRILIQVYLTFLVVKLISKVLIIAYLSFGDFIGEFQVLTLNTLGGFTIILSSSCLFHCYTYLELDPNTYWAVISLHISFPSEIIQDILLTSG